MSFRKNYWSCSAFADRIRGTAKPEAETHEGWNQWKLKAKSVNTIRFWIAETGLDRLQDMVNWPLDQLEKIRYYVNNCWVTRTHTLTSNLKKGSWHEFDTRLLYCMFDELVNFVEIEQAWMCVVFDKESQKKYGVPWWRKSPIKFRKWRCPSAGVDYLNWAANLKIDDEWVDPTDPNYGQPTEQAKTAQITLELYRWWKELRPARPDPYQVSGWSAYCERNREKLLPESEEDRAESRRYLDLLNKIEEDYDREDTEMMIKLIQIRQGLWT